MAHSKYSYYVPGETISYPVVVLFQCSVTSIVTGPIFISGVYLRIGDRLFYCVGDFENYLGSVFGGILTNMLKNLPHLLLGALRPNYTIPLLYHFFICFTKFS